MHERSTRRVTVALAVASGFLLLSARPCGGQTAATQPDEARPLPDGAVMRLGSERFVVSGSILRIAHSADGKMIAAADRTGRITLWDARTGRRLRELGYAPENHGQVTDLRFDAAGNIVCLDHKGGLGVIDPVGGKVLDKEDLVGARRVTRGELSRRGGRVGFTRPDRSGAILDRRSGKVVAALKPPEKANPLDAALSADGKVLAAFYRNNALRVVAEGEDPYVQEDIPVAVATTAGTLSHDGSLVAMGRRHGAVLVYDVKSGALRLSASIEVDKWSGVGELAFSADGDLLAAVVHGGRVRVWDLETKEVVWEAMDGTAYTGETTVSMHGDVLAVSSGQRIDVRDVRTGELLVERSGHGGPVRGLTFSSDGAELISVGLDGRCLRWDLPTGRARPVFRASEPLYAVGAAPADGGIVAAGLRTGFVAADGDAPTTFDLFVTTRRPFLARPEWLDLWSRRMQCAADVLRGPDRQTVRVVTALGVIRAVDASSGQASPTVNWDKAIGLRQRLGLGYEESQRVSVAAAAGVVVASTPHGRDCRLGVYGLTDGATRHALDGRGSWDSVLALSDDGMFLAVSNAAKVTLWELASRGEIRTLPVPGGSSVTALRFGLNGRRLAAGCENGRVAVWALDGAREPELRAGHRGRVSSLGFSPDGGMLASGAADSQILVWDVSDDGRAAKGEDADEVRVEAAWKNLGDGSPAKAVAAMWRLVAAGDRAVDFLAGRMDPAERLDADRADRLIVQLDSDTYGERAAAQEALIKLGPRVEPLVRRALASPGSIEQGRRLEAVLAALHLSKTPRGPALVTRRALAVLERIGGEKAEALLSRLASGPENASITVGAAEVLERMRGRRQEGDAE